MKLKYNKVSEVKRLARRRIKTPPPTRVAPDRRQKLYLKALQQDAKLED